jgi:hypothetical protein
MTGPAVDLAAINEAAARIRETAPLAGDSMTGEECIRWQQLEKEALAELGDVAGERAWRYGLHQDGSEHGVWSDSDIEAVLKLALHWNVPVVAVSVEPIDEDTRGDLLW